MLSSSRFSSSISAAAMLAAALAAQPAFAEMTVVAEDAAAADEIVVTGSALRNSQDIANRRQSLAIVDTLSIDDTGDLVDRSMSNALSRIPGVANMRTLYAESESEYVAVRGITPDLNFTSIDGIGMISVADGGSGTRRIDLGLIPVQAARTTEVFKSFDATMDAGAIGGVINLVPRSAFDARADTFFIDAFASYTTRNRVPGGNVDSAYKDSHFGGGIKGLLTQRFGADGEFGIVLSGEYQQRSYDESKPNPNARVWFTDSGAVTTPVSPDWNGFDPAPTAFNSFEYTNLVKNYGGSATFEYQTTPTWYNSLQIFEYHRDEVQGSPQFKFQNLTNFRDQTQTTGTYTVGQEEIVLNLKDFTSRNRGAIFKSIYDVNERSVLEFRAGYIRSDFREYLDSTVFRANNPGTNLTYDTSGDLYTFTLSDPAAAFDPAKFTNSAKQLNDMRAKGENYEARVDFKNNAGIDDIGFRYSAGAGIRRSEISRDRTNRTYVPRGNLVDALYVDQSFTPYSWQYPTLIIDHRKYMRDIFPTLALNETTSRNNSISSDFTYDETIAYGYVSAGYATERTKFTAGLRLDSVDFRSAAPFTLNGVIQPEFAHAKGNYRHLLPSASLVHMFRDDLRLKASYSRSLGRPAPSEIAQPETRNDVSLTISRGNPDLRPRVSDNIDLAIEKYLGNGGGMITLGGFAKFIKDDIFTYQEDVLIDGVTYRSTTPLNASSSKIGGIEFNYINNALPFLPGMLRDRVGVSFNASRTWGSMNYVTADGPQRLDRLMFQKDWLANAALFMRIGRDGEFRVAYNYQDGYYDTLGARPWLHTGPQATGRVDATLRLRVADAWIVKLQAENLTGSQLYLGQGDDLPYRRGAVKGGRSFYINIIFKP